MRIVSEKIMDHEGNFIGDDASKVPTITNKCLKLITTLKTGRDYKIVERGETA